MDALGEAPDLFEAEHRALLAARAAMTPAPVARTRPWASCWSPMNACCARRAAWCAAATAPSWR